MKACALRADAEPCAQTPTTPALAAARVSRLGEPPRARERATVRS
jgi:hypothetical protein